MSDSKTVVRGILGLGGSNNLYGAHAQINASVNFIINDNNIHQATITAQAQRSPPKAIENEEKSAAK